MFCTNCGQQLSPGMNLCPNCGAHVVTPAASVQMPGIPNYLIQSILVTLCCCMPFGIVAIVYAAQVQSKLAAGDTAGAQASANSARLWCWIGFGIGLVGAIAYGIFTGLAFLNHPHH
jgi:hypothetical protein